MTRIALHSFLRGAATGLLIYAGYLAGAFLAEHLRGRRAFPRTWA